MAFHPLYESTLGAGRRLDGYQSSGSSAFTTYAMAALNTGFSAIHRATTVDDITALHFNFSSVTAAGVITCRIETVDTTTMKPTGTLYDANATKAFTPVAGDNTVTFDTPPTTGRTVGNYYAVVLLTTTGGTTMTLRAAVGGVTIAPNFYQTAADGTTRSNFANVAALPTLTMILETGEEVGQGYSPYFTVGTSFQVYGTRAWGAKFTLNNSVKVRSYELPVQLITGTLPSGITFGIYNGSTLVTGSGVVVPGAASGVTSSTRRISVGFDPITLAAGTYRVIVQQTDTTSTSSNRLNMGAAQGRTNATVPADWIVTSTTDITAGTITWTDDDTELPMISLGLSDTVAAAGSGGGAPIVGSPIVRGIGRVA